MIAFTYQALPSRVVFRVGALADLPGELAKIGARALVLSTPEQAPLADAVATKLGGRAVGVYARAVMHVPLATAAEARDLAKRLGADCCVAVGGGSTIGLGKAIALEYGLPILAVPTTYAGSEMTPIWGLTEGSLKRTGRDLKVLPRTVIYDPELTLSLPAALSGVSGLNAIAHCVEALYAQDANPIMSLMAEEGIRALAVALPAIVDNPSDIEARGKALYGAWLAGTALGSVGMALHHKLCHTLGGAFGLPHAETHAILIAHVAAYNRDHAKAPLARVAAALGAADAGSGLYDLAVRVGARTALKDLSFSRTDIDKAAELATQNPYYNPRPVTREGIIAILNDAVEGRRPV
ncbi:MAG TPA: maleylacetate reductase [Alphaproteobacteria bacterium]|nr:maleylacetate reductase [Alphaproteobacteria bacterium]